MDRKRSFIAHQKVSLSVEQLEDRTVPSIFTPTQIQEAYGFNQIAFSTSKGTVVGNGAGQTIAIVDAYDDPNIVSDLLTFDRAFGLPDPPSFTIMKQSGTVPNSQWASETALDVEWAHAIAPGARILLGEARSNSLSDLVAEVDVVANQPGVSVVSMSWSASEWSSESSFDSNFTTPAGHQGVTYVASTGDDGSPPSWPAIAPTVLSVGGTSLVVNANGSYKSETGWGGSGGGVSADETRPVYQGFVSTGSSKRTDPDVAYDADPTTGLYVYNSYGGGNWIEVGGTSAGAPQWAALVAIADQGRALAGKTTLDGASQTLYAIYRMAQASESTYFHDVTSGNNGYAAKVGYDDVTGNGSPVANKVVAGLVAWNGTGSSGYVGSVAVSASAAVKVAAHTNDFAIPVAPPGEANQFLAAMPSVASVSSGESGYTSADSQPQTLSSTTAFTLATLENNEKNSRMRFSDTSPIDETQSEWNWPFGPNIETTRSSVQTFASDGEVSAEVASGDE